MKTKLLIATSFLILLFSAVGYAQMHRPPMRNPGPRTMRPARQHAMERIHAIKVAYITDRLHFTSEQSAKFWPVYDKYEKDVQSTRKDYFAKYAQKNPGTADDNTSRQFIDDNLDFQQDVLNIRRKYNDEFLKVLSPQQVAQLYKTEREFKELLIQQLKEKRKQWNNEEQSNQQTPSTDDK